MSAVVVDGHKAATDVAQKTVFPVGANMIDAVVSADVQNVDPYIFGALCCSVTSVGVNFPQCIGMSQEGICCACIAYKMAECKPVNDPANPEVKCICGQGYLVFVRPGTVFCKDMTTFFCFENRCAVPCDEEIPFACGLCFVTCFREAKCTTSPNIEVKVLDRIPSLAMKAPEVPRVSRMLSRG